MSNANHLPSPPVRSDRGSANDEKHSTTEPGSSTITDALLGTDPPIEKEHPGLQPALVFASYPLMLIVLISVAAFYFFFIRSKPSGGDVAPSHTESPVQSESSK